VPLSRPIKPSKVSVYLDAETWDAFKAAGYTDEQLAEDTGQIGPVVFAYMRAQAAADGVLVDVTPLARRANLHLQVLSKQRLPTTPYFCAKYT